MEKRYKLVFDDIILKQLKKAGKNKQIKDILTKIFDKIEELGPDAGNLIDSRLFIYEIKLKRPPLRLYYKHQRLTDEIYVFEHEMKTSEEKQQKTIDRIRKKLSES